MYKGGDHIRKYIKKILITLFLSCSISILVPFNNISAKSEITPYAGITSKIGKYLPQPKLVIRLKRNQRSVKSPKDYVAYVTGDCVNLRKEPFKRSESITKLFFNNVIDVYEIRGDYAKVKYEDVVGYISTDYISIREPESTTFNVPYASNKTWMSYTTITSKSSKQFKLQKLAYTGNYGIRMVNNRYCVALGSYFNCEIGQYFDLVLANDVVIQCIMSDQKADVHTDSNNIITIESNCLSEFVVDIDNLNKDAKRDGSISSCTDTWNSHVKKIVIYKKGVEL